MFGGLFVEQNCYPYFILRALRFVAETLALCTLVLEVLFRSRKCLDHMTGEAHLRMVGSQTVVEVL